jgi:2-keto-4-pentenoate hydratase/2-oxohepta-3-ene-1,7-dioic acid hydratase in catechol pathway
MKLIRFGLAENERPGVITAEGTWIDVSAFGEDYNEIFFAGDGIAKLSTWLDSNKDSCPVVEQETRLGPPICRPSKIICVGLNYAKHARESGMEAPTQPVIFYKATTSIIGINDTIVIPKRSEKTDWEVELAVIIGKKAKYIEENEALDYVKGHFN